jgi:chromate transporter
MSGSHELATLALRFAVISLFAIGGGTSTVVPLIRDVSVHELGWLDNRAFTELLAIAQASPGPNFMLVPLIGWHVAGIAGACVSLAAFLAFPVTLAFVVGRILHRHENAVLARLRRAFRPVTAGFWIASGIVIARAADTGVVPAAITAAVALIALRLELNPMWWCLGAGAVGALLA